MGPLARPASTPGGAGEGDDGDDIRGGALTKPFLERLFKRWRELGLR